MNNDNELLQKETEDLLLEIQQLKEQLEYESQKHKQWKELAIVFHDSLWDMVNRYVLINEP